MQVLIHTKTTRMVYKAFTLFYKYVKTSNICCGVVMVTVEAQMALWSPVDQAPDILVQVVGNTVFWIRYKVVDPLCIVSSAWECKIHKTVNM